ncbi:MAG: DNA-protecting protein DprA, partial [Candidatus Shapirobacteria bacterium]|nr:DNA-protecting protein DprA [Candidatus Shapirobacteria bacterium]
DILEELNISAKGKTCLPAGREIRSENADEERILMVIKDEAKQIDEIVRETGMNVGEVMSLMTMMEIKGMVKNLGKMVYGINR